MFEINDKEIEEQIRLAMKTFREITVKAENGYEKALNTAAIVIEADAKRNATPYVDTGRLRGSITHRLIRDSNGSHAEIGTNVEYAPYQEFGTSKMAPQPFLTPAFEANKKNVIEYIKRAFIKAARDAGR